MQQRHHRRGGARSSVWPPFHSAPTLASLPTPAFLCLQPPHGHWFTSLGRLHLHSARLQ